MISREDNDAYAVIAVKKIVSSNNILPDWGRERVAPIEKVQFDWWKWKERSSRTASHGRVLRWQLDRPKRLRYFSILARCSLGTAFSSKGCRLVRSTGNLWYEWDSSVLYCSSIRSDHRFRQHCRADSEYIHQFRTDQFAAGTTAAS